MGVYDPHVLHRSIRLGKQIVVDGHYHLTPDLQGRFVKKQIDGVRDYALNAVLDRHDGLLHISLVRRPEHRRNAGVGDTLRVRIVVHCRLLAVGALRTQIGKPISRHRSPISSPINPLTPC